MTITQEKTPPVALAIARFRTAANLTYELNVELKAAGQSPIGDSTVRQWKHDFPKVEYARALQRAARRNGFDLTDEELLHGGTP